MRIAAVVVVAAVMWPAGAADAQTWSGSLSDCDYCWHVYEFDIHAEPESDVAQTGVMMAWDDPLAYMAVTLSCAPPGGEYREAGTSWGDYNFLRLSIGVFAERGSTCEALIAAYDATVSYKVSFGGSDPRLVSTGGRFAADDPLRRLRYEALAEGLAERRHRLDRKPGAPRGRE